MSSARGRTARTAQGHLASRHEALVGNGKYRGGGRHASHRRSLLASRFQRMRSLQIRLEHTRFPQHQYRAPNLIATSAADGGSRAATLSDLATTISALAAAAQFP